MKAKGKVALVIGAGSSLGRASCKRLTEEGASVVPLEIADADDFVAALQRVARDHGPIDILHHILPDADDGRSILTQSVSDFDAGVSRTVKALFLTLRHILPGMMARGQGRVIVSCSVAALNGRSGAALQVGTDHAVMGLVRAAAMDAAAHGVTVNAICHASDAAAIVPDAVADAALFLASPLAGSIVGNYFIVDGGQNAALGTAPQLASAG